MRLFRHIVVCVLCIAAGCASTAARPLPRSILVVNPSDERGPFYYQIFAALRAGVDAAPGPPVTLYVENLDLSRFFGAQYEASLESHLRVKYGDKPVGVLVAVGPAALAHVLHWRAHLWPDVPIVFVMVDESSAAQLKSLSGITGQVIRFRFQDMLSAARAVVPHLERVAIVGEPLRTQPIFAHLTGEMAAAKDGVKVLDLTGLPMRRLRERLASLPERTAIVYTALYSDGEGTYFPPADAVARLAAVANRPIVVSYETFIGSGAVGGFVFLPAQFGVSAARIALRILGGEAVSNIPIRTADVARPVFDWRALQRWHVDLSNLPPGSEIRYREPSVWDQYRWQISATVALILLQGAMIMGLLYERGRRRRAEVESRRRTAELAHLNRHATAGELSASIAHELNQPLGSIMNNTEAAIAMLASPKPDLAEIRAILGDIRRDDDRASQIITRLRRLLKRTDPESQNVDLNDVVREVFQLLAPEAASHGVTLTSRLAPQPLIVKGDRIQLQQVILNLVVNAIEAVAGMASGAREIIGQTTSADKRSAKVSVADSGPGIEAGSFARVFEPFFTTKQRGMGMGLSIARTIIEAHDGSIDGQPGDRGGAVFNVVLPLIAGD
jgi:signal transduction histidine kinase